MKIDLSKIRIGDKIVIEDEVVDIDLACDDSPIKLLDAGWIAPEFIIEHKPRDIRPGDSVKLAGFVQPYSVIAINGREAWIRLSEATLGDIVPLSDLERI